MPCPFFALVKQALGSTMLRRIRSFAAGKKENSAGKFVILCVHRVHKKTRRNLAISTENRSEMAKWES